MADGAKLTFVENIYFQLPGEQPIDLGAGEPFEYQTQADEEPYSRRYKLNTSPIPLELGYLEECPGMLHIRNLSATGTIKLNGIGIKIPPKQTARFWPDRYALELYATEAGTVAYVTIIPN